MTVRKYYEINQKYSNDRLLPIQTSALICLAHQVFRFMTYQELQYLQYLQNLQNLQNLQDQLALLYHLTGLGKRLLINHSKVRNCLYHLYKGSLFLVLVRILYKSCLRNRNPKSLYRQKVNMICRKICFYLKNHQSKVTK